MTDDFSDISEDLRRDMENDLQVMEKLAFLFSRDTVEQARQVDITDVNLN